MIEKLLLILFMFTLFVVGVAIGSVYPDMAWPLLWVVLGAGAAVTVAMLIEWRTKAEPVDAELPY